ncbi:MAG: ribonuclease HII [Rhodoluna sp.]
MSSKTSLLPSLEFEKTLGTRFIIGLDEVGRGCIAGPVMVGAAVIDLAKEIQWPKNLKDSKLLSEKSREALIPELQAFVASYSVGSGTVEEIEQFGIMQAMALAARRALDELDAFYDCTVVLDGNVNYLAELKLASPVVTKVKADQECVSVAAASVLAKVTRDRIMLDLAQVHDGYDLASNKGYASAKHRSALLDRGPSPIHRISWLGKILQG